MNNIKCLYSVVRYVPDPVRNEPTNLGIIVQCPDLGYANCRFTRNLQQKLGKSATSLDSKILQAYFDEFYSNLSPFSQHPSSAPLFRHDVEALDIQYLYKLANGGPGKIQFTMPQGSLTDNPENELNYLFRTYVGEESAASEYQVKRSRLKTEVKREFKKLKILAIPAEEVKRGFVTDAQVTGGRSKISHVIDFSYVNGKMYLVETVDMRTKDEHEQAFKTYAAAVKLDDLTHGQDGKKIEPYSLIAAPDGEKTNDFIKLLGSYSTVYSYTKGSERKAFFSDMIKILQSDTLF